MSNSSKNNMIFGTGGKLGHTDLQDSKRTDRASKEELELAFAVILVDLASSDGTFDPAEYEVISSGLRQIFATPKDAVQRLINQSKQILDTLRGTSRYTDLLRVNLNEKERKALFSVILDLINADTKKDPFEIYMKNRLAKALDVELEEES